MKASIHPIWYPDASVTCACGNAFTTGSTIPAIKVDICSACHPFFTGKQKFIDTQGQVEKFTKKREVSAVKKVERVKVLENRASKIQKEKTEKPTLKDLLMKARKSS